VRAEDLIGIWTLISCRGESASGETRYPYGETPSGRLTYHSNGLMSAFLQATDRQTFAGDLGQGTSEEIVAAFNSFHAYCGSYTLDGEAGVVTHHVEIARLPDYVGSDQVRYLLLKGDLLTIRTAPRMEGGEEWVFYLEWRKWV
jgi:hypothetical protein